MTDDTTGRRPIPLASADPRGERSDLAPVVESLGDAAVVGLGTATHGCREWFGVCDRLTRTLVADRGVRTVALETDPAATVVADDYVARGEGDATDALTALDDWMWSTAGVRSALDWLRSFNEGRPPTDRVRVRGVDLTPPAGAADRLLSLLPDVDPDLAADVHDELAALAEGDAVVDVDSVPRESFERARDIGRRVEAGLDERDGPAATERDPAGDQVRHLCRAMDRTAAWVEVVADLPERPHADGMAERDRVMAANVRDCLDRGGGGVVAWAHQGHVQRGRFDDGTRWSDAETMGARLDAALGEAYRAVGTDAAGGRTLAVDGRPDGDGVEAFLLPDLAEATLAGQVAEGAGEDAAVLPRAVLDVGADESESPGRDWRLRYVGTVYDPDTAPESYVLETDAGSFDAVVCVDEARASRVLD